MVTPIALAPPCLAGYARGDSYPAWPMLARLCLLAAVAWLAACAAALPGYSPPSFKEPNKYAVPLESGDIGSDGRYAMSATEKAMDCKRLTGSMLITIARLKDAQTRNVGSQFASST